MENVLLGFLMLMPRSQYDMLKALEREVSPFYQASLGSIQSALKKLLAKDYIIMQKDVHNGRNRNMYSITDQGREAFRTYMLAKVNPKKLEVEASTKLFFLGLVSQEDRLYIVRNIVNDIEQMRSQYLEVDQQNKDIIIPKGYETIAYYQLKCLDFALAQFEVIYHKYKGLLEDLEK